MIDLAKNGYSHEEIQRALHMVEGSRNIRFRYNLLDKNDNVISELKTVESGEVSHSAFAEIKRTARFSLREESVSYETYATWGDIGSLTWAQIHTMGEI